MNGTPFEPNIGKTFHQACHSKFHFFLPEIPVFTIIQFFRPNNQAGFFRAFIYQRQKLYSKSPTTS